jgi:hypothetical protein
MKNRKQLPHFFKLKRTIDVNAIIEYLRQEQLLDYDRYNDIKKSANSPYKSFLVGNHYSKNKFFIADDEEKLEGELYKQLYLTTYNGELNEVEETATTTKDRLRRIEPDSKNYIPELDEHKFGKKNDFCKGILSELLDSFLSPCTRVRLAVLMPGMTIKPHRDYDPSYICRYHIPLITNPGVEFGMKVDGIDTPFQMQADGSIYFFNSGLPHWVTNNGTEPRLHIVLDTNGQLDLET